MLIDFSIENFRSFREKQFFTMEAAPYLQNKLNVISFKAKGHPKLLKLLRVAAIYGPNASGKSNLVLALNTLNSMVHNETNTSSDLLPVSSFRFDSDLIDKPSKFQISFITEGIIYRYELSATAEKIHHEALYESSTGKPLPIFIRQLNKTEEYIFPNLEGNEALHEAWVNLTNPKQTFLGQAASNSNDSLRQLKIPFDWLRHNLRQVPKDLSDLVSVMQIVHSEIPDLDMSSQLASFLSDMDIPISTVKFNTEYKLKDIDTIPSEDSDERSRRVRNMLNKSKVSLIHKTALGEASFSFHEESEGTKNLSGFNLLWSMLMETDSFQVMVFDELDSSLHPKIIERLIQKLINKQCNSQLIFTTHNTHLMDSKLLRRDQFWLTERDNNGATQLTSIYDYEGRESEDVEKRYFEGRYRGLPNISNN